MPERTPAEVLDEAIVQYLASTGHDVGIVGDWVVVVAQQLIIDGAGNTGTYVTSIAGERVPDYRAMGLLESALAGFKAKITKTILQ